jgi:hypothetical protein
MALDMALATLSGPLFGGVSDRLRSGWCSRHCNLGDGYTSRIPQSLGLGHPSHFRDWKYEEMEHDRCGEEARYTWHFSPSRGVFA